ncbi:MAG: phage tail baseplate protein, partial [Beijerinckiaceae bacterium]
SRLDVEPGDVVALAGAEWRIERIADSTSRLVTAVRADRQAHAGAPRPSRPRRRPAPGLSGPALPVVLDLASAETEPAPLQRIAVSAEPWAGGYVLWRSDDGASFTPDSAVSTRATIGALAAPLPAGPLWRFDRHALIDVVLSHGALQAVSETASLSGVNLLAVEAPGAGWEIISFAGAALTGPNAWRLSTLVRGLAGSEPAAAVAKPAGAKVVILDGAVQPLATGAEALGRKVFWRLAPAGRDHADPMAVAFESTPGPAALLPLSPVQLRARRLGGGVSLSWIRRTRIGGDAFDAAEVPLGEEAEAYLVEVMDGASVKRTVEVPETAWLYPAADEITDFGGPQTDLEVRISQISRAAGPGMPAQRLLAIQ